MNMYLFAGREPGSEREFDCEIFSDSHNDALEQAKKYFGCELSEITLIKVERDENEPAPKVLVACEESQVVTIELRKLGHEAFSCDIQDCSGGHQEWHIKGDVLSIVNDGWDMIIAFPPCTHLSAAGAPSWKQKQADGRQQSAIDFVYKIRDANCELIAIENPTGKLNSSWRKPDQIVNPFQFGDPFKKRTCLWLKGLPNLTDTNLIEPKYHHTSNSTRGCLLKDGTRNKSKLPYHKAWNSTKERSKTFTGIAKAMAKQWGDLL